MAVTSVRPEIVLSSASATSLQVEGTASVRCAAVRIRHAESEREGEADAHLAAGGRRLARLDEKVVDEAHLAPFVAAAVAQAEVGELLLLEEVDASVGRGDDRERVDGRRVELFRR